MESGFQSSETASTSQILKKFVAQKIRNPDHNRVVGQLNLRAVSVARLEQRIHNRLDAESIAKIYDECDKAVAKVMASIVGEIAFDIACDRMLNELREIQLLDITKQIFLDKFTNSKFNVKIN